MILKHCNFFSKMEIGPLWIRVWQHLVYEVFSLLTTGVHQLELMCKIKYSVAKKRITSLAPKLFLYWE